MSVESEKERYNRYLCSREWGLLREQVRARCGGKCERCNVSEMTHVHHLTYERKYNERLDDLQGLCEPCHLFTHGLSDVDPITEKPPEIDGVPIRSVYLAGRISGDKGEWRGDIVPGWSTSGPRGGCDQNWWKVDQFGEIVCVGDDCEAVLPSGDNLSYVGPFWCDLGGGHGFGCGPHAAADVGDVIENGSLAFGAISDPVALAASIFRSIDYADLVFAWIDSREAYGTIFELGLAFSMRCLIGRNDKRIVIAMPDWDRELWLSCRFAHRVILAPSAKKAWEWLWTVDGIGRERPGVFDVMQVERSYGVWPKYREEAAIANGDPY